MSNPIAAQNVADSLRIDHSNTISKRYFNTDLNQKYKGKSYLYEDALKEYKLNFWQKFQIWLAEKIQKIFNFANPGKSHEHNHLGIENIGYYTYFICPI